MVTATFEQGVQQMMKTMKWMLAAAPTPGVVATRIHYSPAAGQYPNAVTVGNVTRATLTVPIGTNYFVATTVDASGAESDFSNEVSATVLPPANVLRIQPYVFRLDWDGLPGTLQTTTNFQVWTDLLPIAPGATVFVTNSAPQQFFRVRTE